MLERKTSSDTEISVNYKKYGVVLFIFGESGNVLVLKEKTSNPENEKLAGNLSVLCETSETGENWKDTVMRGIREELSLTDEQVSDLVQFGEDSYLGECDFIEHMLARVVKAKCDERKLLEVVRDNEEVEIMGFMPIDTLLDQNTRLGVRNVIANTISEFDHQ